MMVDEGYNSSAWDSASNAPDSLDAPPITTSYGRALRSLDNMDASSSHSHALSSSQPRSSTDSLFRQTKAPSLDHRDTMSTVGSEAVSLVDSGFDEKVLRTLCDLDCGVPLVLDRIKQSMVSCREASIFFKKRAMIEEEYGKSLHKLARLTSETYAANDGKAGSFVNAWQNTMRIHETMGDNRLRFASRLNEMSEELSSLSKEVDKNRKQSKDLSMRYERALQEAELATEKAKNRLDMTTEELERLLLQKEGESLKDNALQGRQPAGASGKRVIGKAVAKGGLLLKGKNPGNIQRQEEDIRLRMSQASDAYRKVVIDAQAMRQEYFNLQLPKILRSLKECADEIDLGTQYHMTRYAFLFESIILTDGTTIVPGATETALGLKASIEMIDNRTDFKTYMQNYAYARGSTHPRGPRREGPADEGFLPPLPSLHGHGGGAAVLVPAPASSVGHSHSPDRGRPTFGVDLADQMIRDNVELPPLVVKCCEAIEKYGLKTQGVYRLSGTTSKVASLKQKLDKDLDSVDLDAPEWAGDINNVTSVLKMWFRELPDPLMTYGLQPGFIEAAKIENERMRHIRLHERVNDLPDANYATLKYFLGHLQRINQHETFNSMSIQNLAIVFGPTLFGQMVPGLAGIPNGQSGVTNGGGMADAAYQSHAIETILTHYNDIFIDESQQQQQQPPA